MAEPDPSPHGRGLHQHRGLGGEPAAPHVRVLTWNLKYGVEYHAAAELLRTHSLLRGADIVLLQEMDEVGTTHVAEALTADYAYASAARHAHTGRDFGNAIVSRWPMRGRAEIPLPHVARVSGQPRSATHAVVEVDGIEIAAYSVHTEIPLLGFRRRVEQYDAVATHVRAIEQQHVVVGGDFNTLTRGSRRALATSMSSSGLRAVATPPAPSYRRHRWDLALDHVFVRGATVAAAGVLSPHEVGATSDHRPVWAVIERVSPGSST